MALVAPSLWTLTTSVKSALITLDGDGYWVQTAGKPWSIASADDNLIRFEVRAADVWEIDSRAKERSEVASTEQIPNGVPVHVSYAFQIEPGAKNTADWSVFGQFHQNDVPNAPGYSPPFAVGLAGEKMTITVRYLNAAGAQVHKVLYTDSQDIVRGHDYRMDVRAVFDPQGKGSLVVTRDGVTIADYTGPLGFPNQSSVYWKEGIYREASAETIVVSYKDLAITTGDQALVSAASSLPVTAASVAGPSEQLVLDAGANADVVALTHQFFTGAIPSAAGFAYLLSPTGGNPNSLGSAYYESFNLENRFINFAVNLGKSGAGRAAFEAQYGGLDMVEATRKAYQTIFGAAPGDAKVHELIDGRVDYFAAYGQDGPNGVGAKAAMAGWLLAEAQKAHVGTYAQAQSAFLHDLADGASFSVDLIGQYAPTAADSLF